MCLLKFDWVYFSRLNSSYIRIDNQCHEALEMPEMCIRISITKNMMSGGGIIVLVLLGTQSSSDTNIHMVLL